MARGRFPPSQTATRFTDIKPEEYYYTAIRWAAENGIAKGVTETTFKPDDPITRSQAMVFLWRMAKMPTAGKASGFADVSPADSYYGAVNWAAETGVTKGDENLFKPDNTCNRAHFVTFLYRYYHPGA